MFERLKATIRGPRGRVVTLHDVANQYEALSQELRRYKIDEQVRAAQARERRDLRNLEFKADSGWTLWRASDGTRWVLRTDGTWMPADLPQPEPAAPVVSAAEHRAAIEALRYLWMTCENPVGNSHRQEALAMAEKVLNEYDAKESDHA